jgi:hypothetical protein
VDRINVNVDFEGDGRTAYNFCVSSTNGIGDGLITNQTSFNDDWDGHWLHAVGEDEEGWSAELLIPWHIAPMAKSNDGERHFRIYLDRVIGSTGERMAWPAASWDRSRFVSDFAPLDVPAHSTALLAITPYVSGLYDNVAGDSSFEGGADVLWKPNGQFQLTATLNPDFGQVESDDLVVNFGADESFFSDKRPFFTENQSLFEFTMPADSSQLLYTRRVGAGADDGSGPAGIDAALKFNGNVGSTKYGMFLAEEADDVGRSFRALRLVHDYEHQNLGLMMTQVEHPYLDREADVIGVDHDWRPTARWNVRTRLVGSDIEQDNQNQRGNGATLWADYEMDHGWRQQWILMHFDDSLEINDFGYLNRNNLNYAHWQVSRRFTDLPEGSRYASKDWRWRISGSNNDHGLPLLRQSQLRDGSSEYAQININSAGYDDRFTRGGHPLRLPPSFNSNFNYVRPRKGDWAYETNVNLYHNAVGHRHKLGRTLFVSPTWFANDHLSFNIGLSIDRDPNWAIWQQGNTLGTFDVRFWQLNGGLKWSIDDRQELRVKLQSIAMDAHVIQGWDVQPDGNVIHSATPVGDFSLNNFGFQIRYRRELAPLSYLYIVYGRGGDMFNEDGKSTESLLGDAFSLRDSEQLVVKLAYRFEL